MKALATQPNVSVKFSMLTFVRNGWESSPEKFAEMKGLIRETLDLFGAERCMFASNFPVDRVNGGFSANSVSSDGQKLLLVPESSA